MLVFVGLDEKILDTEISDQYATEYLIFFLILHDERRFLVGT